MVSYALVVLATVTVALAGTPPGFQPGSGTELIVDFGNTAINGQVVPKNTVANQPEIGTNQRLTGQSYAVIMVDLDIPTNNTRETTTLLHWMQTGLTSAATASRLGTQNNVFQLENRGNTPAAAAYISPNPPARQPLSHTYTQILVDTSGIQTQSTNALQNAAKTRQGFNVEQVLSQAGLAGKVVAGNFFNVTNPGPVNTKVDDDGTLDANTTSMGSMTMSMPMATNTPSAGNALSAKVAAGAALVGVAGVFLGV
jgi:phosphatidylethanolamine-binding protein (PEBP) family uncharacterized protein